MLKLYKSLLESISKIGFWFKIPSSPKGFAGTRAADLWFVTHRQYKIRWGIQQRWKTRHQQRYWAKRHFSDGF